MWISKEKYLKMDADIKAARKKADDAHSRLDQFKRDLDYKQDKYDYKYEELKKAQSRADVYLNDIRELVKLLQLARHWINPTESGAGVTLLAHIDTVLHRHNL